MGHGPSEMLSDLGLISFFCSRRWLDQLLHNSSIPFPLRLARSPSIDLLLVPVNFNISQMSISIWNRFYRDSSQCSSPSFSHVYVVFAGHSLCITCIACGYEWMCIWSFIHQWSVISVYLWRTLADENHQKRAAHHDRCTSAISYVFSSLPPRFPVSTVPTWSLHVEIFRQFFSSRDGLLARHRGQTSQDRRLRVSW